MSTLPNLKELYLSCTDPSFNPLSTPEQQVAAISNVSGVTALKKITGLERVLFSGDCPVMAQTLKPIMEAPGSQKRKNREGEVEDWGLLDWAGSAKKAKHD